MTTLTFYNILILSFCVAVVTVIWLWRYCVNPFIKRKSLKKNLQKHPHIEQLIDIEGKLLKIFKDVNGRRISQEERKRLDIQDDAFIYGEIEFLPFFTLLDRVKPQSGEIFYDLGSGTGKAVFAAAAFFDFAKTCGIEFLPKLCEISRSLIKHSDLIAKGNILDSKKFNTTKNIETNIKFINDDFIKCDFHDGDIIFINATCISYFMWQELIKKFESLKPGSRIIVTSKKIEHSMFASIYHGFELMSWGMNSVNLYKKIS